MFNFVERSRLRISLPREKHFCAKCLLIKYCNNQDHAVVLKTFGNFSSVGVIMCYNALHRHRHASFVANSFTETTQMSPKAFSLTAHPS